MRRLLIIPILLSLLCVGCRDDQVAKVAKALDIMAHTVGSLQDVVIESNSRSLISDEDTAKVLDICWKLNMGGKQGVEVVRNYYNAIEKLKDKGMIDSVHDSTMLELSTILLPVLEAANKAIEQDILKIKEETDESTGVVLFLDEVDEKFDDDVAKILESVKVWTLAAQVALKNLQGILLAGG